MRGNAPARYVYAVRNRNGSPFPYQLLTEDCAWPARGADARALHEHAGYVQLESMQPPRIERWASLGWDVVGA